MKKNQETKLKQINCLGTMMAIHSILFEIFQSGQFTQNRIRTLVKAMLYVSQCCSSLSSSPLGASDGHYREDCSIWTSRWGWREKWPVCFCFAMWIYVGQAGFMPGQNDMDSKMHTIALSGTHREQCVHVYTEQTKQWQCTSVSSVTSVYVTD